MRNRVLRRGVSGLLAATFALAASASIAAPAASITPAPSNQLVPAQSEIRFTAKQMGVPMQGVFKKMDGQVIWNAAQPEQSRIRLVVSVASATLGAPEMDDELPKAAWFDAARFPQAVFEAQRIQSLGAGKFAVSGTLSIKGVSLPVQTQALFTPTPDGQASIATGQLEIQRLAYQIGAGAWGDSSVVANPVTITYRIRINKH